MKTSKRLPTKTTRAKPKVNTRTKRAATTKASQSTAPAQPSATPAPPIAPALQPPTPPPTREELVARLDGAIERAQQCRTELRLAEREMIEARHAIERLDDLASRPTPPVHRR